MSNPFATPGTPGTGIKFDDYLNHLLYIEPLSVEHDIKTVHGLSDAIRANVAVLDGPDAGTEYPDTLIFPKVLQGQLRSKVGEKVLGRLTQGNQKPGQNPPWMLAEANEADIELGIRWINRDGQTAAPAQVESAKVPF